MRFDDLKLRTKTLIPLIGMAVVFALVIASGAFRLNDLTHRYGQILSGVDPAILRLNRAARIAVDISRDVYQDLNYESTDPRARAADADFVDAKAEADKSFDEAAALNPTKADPYRAFKDRFDDLYQAALAPRAIAAAIPGLAVGSKMAPADLDKMGLAAREIGNLDVQIGAFSTQILAFNHDLEAENAKTVATLQQDAVNTIIIMIASGAAAIAVGLALAIWIANTKVAAPLVRLGERMRALAQGDLAVEVEGQARGDEVGVMAKAVQVFKDNALRSRALEAEAVEQRGHAEKARAAGEQDRARAAEEQAVVVGSVAEGLAKLSAGVLTYRIDRAFTPSYEKLRADFNDAIGQLQETLKVVAANTTGITSGTDEIAQASDDLSRRTEQQAASLEQTAAALDQITATVKKTALSAREASEAIGAARTDAVHSGEVVSDAVQAMGQIEQSSKQISQIIGVIDEIAFQTNLLALNAGVEAARAGEAGRGFAVVASEVRALAQRSAEAAKEIKTLISASSQQVGRGVDLVGETGQALQSIVAKVAEIDLLVTEIAASAQEQASGLTEVNVAVNQMDQVVQQNAAMVEQATAATHSLKRDAGELKRLISRFQVSGASSAVSRPSPEAATARSLPAPSPVRAMARKLAVSFGESAPDSWQAR
jgi:methyl-accepting chemotaxis protein